MTETTFRSWANPTDVNSITGADVEPQDVMTAQGIIEIVSHREFGYSYIRPRDLRWLKKSVAYQAAWIPAHPDLFQRMSYKSLQQDGMATQFNEKADVYLAPLAKRALKNCSWMRSRSLRMATPFMDGTDFITTNPLAEADDGRLDWEGM